MKMIAGSLLAIAAAAAASPSTLHVRAEVTLPASALGTISSLGSIFELRTADGTLVAHAGSTYATDTYYSLPTTELNFYVAASDAPEATWTDLGQPFPGVCCVTRLVPFGGELYAVNREVPEHENPFAQLQTDGSWKRLTRIEAGMPVWGGSLDVCGGRMSFERLGITFNGKYIYDLPGEFDYMFGHYHNGQVLVYGVASYFSNAIIVGKYACGASAITITHRFADPVDHQLQPRNWPYAWLFVDAGVLLATNLGYVYLADTQHDDLRVLKAHGNATTSWQPYTFVRWFNETLVGQYPAGTVFAYNGDKGGKITPFDPPVAPEPGASTLAREAQTFAIYDGELLLGVWPWGAIHAKGPARNAPWRTKRRLFSTPPITDVEAPWMDYLNGTNQWGQRVNGMTTFNGSLYATTSAKNPITDDLYRGRLPAQSEAEYARVHRLSVANEASGRMRLGGRTQPAKTVLDFELSESALTIHQDGVLIASSTLDKPLHYPPGDLQVHAGQGIYGPTPSGVHVDAKVV